MTAQTLDWFTFETKMRNLVSGMVEPTIKQSSHNETEINLLLTFQKHLITKIDELEFIVVKSTKRSTATDSYAK